MYSFLELGNAMAAWMPLTVSKGTCSWPWRQLVGNDVSYFPMATLVRRMPSGHDGVGFKHGRELSDGKQVNATGSEI